MKVSKRKYANLSIVDDCNDRVENWLIPVKGNEKQLALMAHDVNGLENEFLAMIPHGCLREYEIDVLNDHGPDRETHNKLDGKLVWSTRIAKYIRDHAVEEALSEMDSFATIGRLFADTPPNIPLEPVSSVGDTEKVEYRGKAFSLHNTRTNVFRK